MPTSDWLRSATILGETSASSVNSCVTFAISDEGVLLSVRGARSDSGGIVRNPVVGGDCVNNIPRWTGSKRNCPKR